MISSPFIVSSTSSCVIPESYNSPSTCYLCYLLTAIISASLSSTFSNLHKNLLHISSFQHPPLSSSTFTFSSVPDAPFCILSLLSKTFLYVLGSFQCISDPISSGLIFASCSRVEAILYLIHAH